MSSEPIQTTFKVEFEKPEITVIVGLDRYGTPNGLLVKKVRVKQKAKVLLLGKEMVDVTEGSVEYEKDKDIFTSVSMLIGDLRKNIMEYWGEAFKKLSKLNELGEVTIKFEWE